VTARRGPSGLHGGLSGVLAGVDLAFRWVVAAVTMAMMTLIVADATGRLLNRPIPGAVEITEEYLMVAIVFLAIGFTHTEGRHIRIELFERIVPALGGPIVRIAVSAISLGYFALIAYQGGAQTAYALRIDQRSASELGYPLGPAYALVVVGSGMVCVWLVRDIVRELMGRGCTSRETREAPTP
jgi:TRAP-type transport system small permease protein